MLKLPWRSKKFNNLTQAQSTLLESGEGRPVLKLWESLSLNLRSHLLGNFGKLSDDSPLPSLGEKTISTLWRKLSGPDKAILLRNSASIPEAIIQAELDSWHPLKIQSLAVISNPSLSEAQLLTLFKALSRHSDHPRARDTLDRIVRMVSYDAFEGLSGESLEELYKMLPAARRGGIARNPRLTAEAMRHLFSGCYPDTFQLVATHKNTPPDLILHMIAFCEDSSVAYWDSIDIWAGRAHTRPGSLILYLKGLPQYPGLASEMLLRIQATATGHRFVDEYGFPSPVMQD